MSSCCAAVWTVIRADKRSVWRDSNESRGFVPLLAHKHYIEHFSNFFVLEENYIAIIIVIELSPSPSGHTHLEQWAHTHTPGAVGTHTLTPGAVDTHTHTHLEQWAHTHTPGAVGTHTRTHLEQWTLYNVHSGEAPARPPHVTLYKIHSFETQIILTFTIKPLFRQ